VWTWDEKGLALLYEYKAGTRWIREAKRIARTWRSQSLKRAHMDQVRAGQEAM
jgi:hypothetical protein